MPEDSVPSLKHLMVGGEAMAQNLMEKWRTKCSVYNGYGPCECTILTHFHPFQGDESARTIGLPLPGVECSVNEKGELYLGGIGIKTEDGQMFRTGDLVRLLPGGLYEYVGRKNSYIKINGCRVDLHYIEDRILKIPGIKEATVIPIEMQSDRPILACFYTSGLVNQKELKKTLRSKVPGYMVPSQYFRLEELPRLTNGKIDRMKLQSMEVAEKSPEGNSFSHFETKLAGIWREILGETPKYDDDDFFQMGGDSLCAIKLMIEIEKKLGRNITMKDLLEHATFRDFAEFIGSQQKNHDMQTVITIQGEGSQVPLFLIHPSIGLAECYRSLSQHLLDTPIYAIQNPHIFKKPGYFSSVSEMASYYAKEIAKVRSKGPYNIGGWSFGGVVALEVACILQDLGETIDSVILVDSYAPGAVINESPLLVHSKELLFESAHNSKLAQAHQASCFEGRVFLIRSHESKLWDNGWHFLPNLSISEVPVLHHELFDSKYFPITAAALDLLTGILYGSE